MSSLAASRADNFYFPPDYDGRKHGGLSKFNGSKGSNQWEQYGVIRFELPMDAWCMSCERHMSRGLRFNAKKDKIGKYLSTILYSFTMNCPSCNNKFIIKTDPENDTYDFSEGIRKMEQNYQPDINDGVIDILSDETKFQLANDPIFLMQHNLEGKIKTQSANERLEALIDIKESSKLDYDINSILRAKNRKKKEHLNLQIKEGIKNGINVPLLDATNDDIKNSKSANFHMTKYQRNVKQNEKRKLADILSQSILHNTNNNKKIKNNNDNSSFNSNLKNSISKEVSTLRDKQNIMKKAISIKVENFKSIVDKNLNGNIIKKDQSITIKCLKKDTNNNNNNNNNNSSSSSSNNIIQQLYNDDD